MRPLRLASAAIPLTPAALIWVVVATTAASAVACGQENVVTPPVRDGTPPVFSTFLGGSEEDQPRDVAIDGAGNIYVTGGTKSFDFPTTAGAPQPAHHPGPPVSASIAPFDVFVTKLTPDGQLAWSTYLGGPNYDRAYAIDVDAQGFIYLAGRAGPGFPVTPGVLQSVHQGGTAAGVYGPQDGFICKLRPDGSTVFCTFFGTSDPNIVRDLAVDAQGYIYIASSRESGAWAASIAGAFTNAPKGDRDAVIAKISGDGSRVLWATYLGGSSSESGQNSVRLDAVGSPYVLLTSGSADAPTTAGAFQRTNHGGGDLYIAKLDAQTGALVWASFLGGSRNESTETHEFAVSPDGHVFVAAPTQSLDYPVTPGALQASYGGGLNDMFVAHIAPDGSSLIASTYLGGDTNDRPEGVAVDSGGNVYLTGLSGSANYPVTKDAFQSTFAGERDAVVVKLPPTLDRVTYASYLGAAGDDFGRGARVTASGGVFVAVGQSGSADFPTVHSLHGYRGNFDGFVAAFRLP